MFSRRPPRKVLHWLPIFFAMTMLPGCERGGTGNDEGVRKPVSDSMPIASHLSPAAPRFTYVVDAGNDTIAVRKIDQDPRHPGGGQAPKASQSVSIHPSGRFAYVANDLSDQISAYSIDATTGVLTRIGTPVATGMTPRGITIHPSGNFAYVPNFSSGDVSVYSIDKITGTLVPVGTAVAAGANPISVSIDPNGRIAYVANFNAGDESAFEINPITGALIALGTTRPQGGNPFSAVTRTDAVR